MKNFKIDPHYELRTVADLRRLLSGRLIPSSAVVNVYDRSTHRFLRNLSVAYYPNARSFVLYVDSEFEDYDNQG